MKPGYWLHTEEICIALNNSGIRIIEQSRFLIQDVDDKFLKENALKNLRGENGNQNFKDEAKNVINYDDKVNMDILINTKTSIKNQINDQMIISCEVLEIEPVDCGDKGNCFKFTTTKGNEYIIPSRDNKRQDCYFANTTLNEDEKKCLLKSMHQAIDEKYRDVFNNQNPTPQNPVDTNPIIGDKLIIDPIINNPSAKFIANISRNIDGSKIVKIAQLKQTDPNVKISFTDKVISDLAENVIVKTIGHFKNNPKQGITKDDVVSFVNVMKQMILKKIDKVTQPDVAGKNAGFKAWSQDIKSTLGDDKDELMGKFKLISAQIQKQANKIFDTIEGRNYKTDGNGARSFRVIQMLDGGDIKKEYDQNERGKSSNLTL
jgi:hypothetical protein